MGDTFGGIWNRPGERRGKDRQRGRTMRQLQDRAHNDNEPQLGCGAILLLCILALAAAIGMAVS